MAVAGLSRTGAWRPAKWEKTMSKPIFHATSNSERHNGQPEVDRPGHDAANPDPDTGSGYPAGGHRREQGKDAYGRGLLQRRQAGLPPDPDDDPTPAKSR
ncbi:hypothetical protein [Achromobacter insuavis]|uniref:hypothetical protein n=1 Tax=Achromobacter insuavis TaxID=1287735 RepID=UPI001F137369|nr:hypothetical protein [Achromobacter insuavis]